MRILSIILMVALLTMGSVNAQRNVSFGVKGGLNIASIGGDNTDDLDSRLSFHVGGLVEIPVSEIFSVQGEVLYSEQGATFDGANFDADGVDGVIALNYINVPVLAKIYINDRFAFEVGPQIGFIASAKTKAEFQGNEDEMDIEDDVERINFSTTGGVSYTLDQGLFFVAKYNIGFVNVFKENGDDNNQSNAFQIGVGYKFN